MSGKFEITKRFGFEAAHNFPQMGEGHRYARLHGHSFEVDVTIGGTRDKEHGWVADFDDVDAALQGLENPSLENIAAWIAEKLLPQFPGLARVTVRRPSCGESCTYSL